MLQISEVVDKFVPPLIILMLALGITTSSNWFLPLYVSFLMLVCIQVAYIFSYLKIVREEKLKPSIKGYIAGSRGDVISICFYFPFISYVGYSIGFALSYWWHVYS